MSCVYDWAILDNELINSYSKGRKFFGEFLVRYNISVTTAKNRLKKLGIRLRTQSESVSKENHPQWEGGSHIENGYVLISIGDGKYKPEHVLVMEKHLGRKLLPREIVHHIDESFEGRSKNVIGNLQLINRSDHNRHHRIGKGKGYSIYFSNTENKWILKVSIDGIRRTKGRFMTKERAEKYYNEWCIR